jgi:hypothetical protein
MTDVCSEMQTVALQDVQCAAIIPIGDQVLAEEP